MNLFSVNRKLSIFFLLTFCTIQGFGQTDFGGWSGVSLFRQIDSQNAIEVKPIFIHNENFSNFNQLFIDISFKHKINKYFNVALLSRSITNNTENYRHWFFVDFNSGFPIKRIRLSHRLRYHHGHDFLRYDRDFIRFYPNISYALLNNWKVSAGVEMQTGLGMNTDYFRNRYALSSNYKLSDRVVMSNQLWLEDFSDISGIRDILLVITNFQFKL